MKDSELSNLLQRDAPPDLLAELAAAQERIKALEGEGALYMWLMQQNRSMWDAISKAIDRDAAVKSEYRRHQSAIDAARNTEGRVG